MTKDEIDAMSEPDVRNWCNVLRLRREILENKPEMSSPIAPNAAVAQANLLLERENNTLKTQLAAAQLRNAELEQEIFKLKK